MVASKNFGASPILRSNLHWELERFEFRFHSSLFRRPLPSTSILIYLPPYFFFSHFSYAAAGGSLILKHLCEKKNYCQLLENKCLYFKFECKHTVINNDRTLVARDDDSELPLRHNKLPQHTHTHTVWMFQMILVSELAEKWKDSRLKLLSLVVSYFFFYPFVSIHSERFRVCVEINNSNILMVSLGLV